MNLSGDFVFNGGTFELNDFSILIIQGNSTVNDEFSYAGNPGNGAFVNMQGSSTFNAPASFSQWVNVCSSDPLTPSDLGNATPGCVTPLPIELISFEAAHNGADFIFEWETASELNNAYYFIEVSNDLIYWERIAQLDGGGTLPYGNSYEHLVYGTRYMPYARLIQQDFDGRQEIFTPVSVSESKGFNEIYLRYDNDVLYLSYKYKKSYTGELMIVDQSGRVIVSKNVNINNDTNEIGIGLLPSGLYYVFIESMFNRLIVINK